MSKVIVKRRSSEPGPIGMPTAVNRGGISYLMPVKLDPKRCWLMKRPRLGHPGEEELILTPASLSTNPSDEDELTDFLDRFSWKVALSIANKQTASGRQEHFWLSPPHSFKDPGQIIALIQSELESCLGGAEQLKNFEAGFREGKLHLVLSLDVV